MRIADISINQPVFITMVVFVIVVVGAMAFGNMGLDLLPDVSVPIVVVQTVYPGASPAEVESLVSKPLEEAFSSLNRVQSVRSTSAESLSLVIIEFDMEYSARPAGEDVRERMSAVRPTLPSDVQEPVIAKYDPNSLPIMIIAVSDRTGRTSPASLRTLADTLIKPRLERVDGVASVTLAGGQEREIHVDLDLDRVKAHNIPVQNIVGAIKSENLNLPGGRLTLGQNEQLLRTAGEFKTVEEIGWVQVPRAQGSPVLVRDLATVTDGFKEARQLTRLNGQGAVTLSILKQSGTNTVRVADLVKERLREIEGQRPELEFKIVGDQSTFTRDSSNDVLLSLLMGGTLAALVVLVFFRDLRNTLVTVAGLPMIILGTFAIMKAIGFGLNMLTLMALSLSIGMLIDDAIVVRENIFRHMERGEDPKTAARNGTAEIALAVLATTLTIVAVFAPVASITGIAGKFFREFGITVVIAVLISLFEAFTLAPMLSAHLFKARANLKPEHQERDEVQYRGAFGRVALAYRGLLGFALKVRPMVVLVAAVVFVAGGLVAIAISKSFIPAMSMGEARIFVEMPAGSSLAQTDQAVQRIESILLEQPGMEYVFSQVGSTSSGVDKATVYLKIEPAKSLDPMIHQIRPEIAAIPGITFNVDTSSIGGLTAGSGVASSMRSRPVQVSVEGSDMAELERVSGMIEQAMRSIPGTVDVGRSLSAGKPEAQVRVNRDLSADLGVNTVQVASTVRTLVNGDNSSKFRTPEKDFDIVVRLREQDRQRPADILQLPVGTTRGGQVPLSAIATVENATGPAQVERQDRQRQIIVGTGYEGRVLGDVTDDIRQAISSLDIPPGVTIRYTGESKYMAEAMSSLMTALMLAVLFIYVVLASQFGSFTQPFIIMLALPLSIVGAFGALMLTGKSFDMMAMIGLIMLMGLVTKNSILLIDFINVRRRAGMPRNEAILMAGPIRLRPILMTTIAMIFGMVPTAVGFGTGVEMREPMAIAVIGGLIVSTLLTLLVVPVAYTILDDLLGLFRRLFSPSRRPAIAGASEAEEE